MDKAEACSVLCNVRFLDVRVFTLVENYERSGLASRATSFLKNKSKIDFYFDSSYNSFDFVEKMWRSLRKSRWVNGGKVLHTMVDKPVLHILDRRFTRFGGFGGKFCARFAQGFHRGRSGVLHIFHIAYYYNY